jgi:predicted P-loop ATPase
MDWDERLLRFLSADNQDDSAPKQEDLEDDSQLARERYIRYLQTADPAVENQRGDDTTFHVAREAKVYGLSTSVALELLLEYYNPKCVPPWDTDELQTKVENAYEFSTIPLGAANANHAFAVPETFTIDDLLQQEEALRIRWQYHNNNPNSPIEKNLSNCMNYFILPIREDLETHEVGPNELYRLIRFNEFSEQIEFTRPAPWHRSNSPVPYWTDADVVQARVWLTHKQHFDCGAANMQDAAIAVSKFYSYHPVRDYLNALKWDGLNRLDTWLTVYAGASQTPYVQTVGTCTLIASVARIFDPGTQHDSMLILEGPQGTGKTSLVRILGGSYYADILLDPHNKDTVAGLQGAWFLELSELAFLRRHEVAAIKRFLTVTSDKVRLAYARNTVVLPRQCIFIGTINPGKNPAYLSDTDGNRRFWPVATGAIDLEALRRDRDQLFAEAVSRFKAGENHHLTDPTVIAQANMEALYRVDEDAWQEVVEEWLNDQQTELLTTMTIAIGALNIHRRNLDRITKSRICRIMENIGYERTRVMKRGISAYVWYKDELEGI